MIHPEAGQKTPWSGSFSEIVHKELAFRQSNPALTQKNGWSLDPDDVAADVDLYNCQRMVAANYLGFVELEGEAPEKKTRLMGNLFKGAGNVAVGDSAITGLAVYRELFSGKSKPVAKEEAERRAEICVSCPLNNTKHSFKERFVNYVAKGLTELVGIMRDMEFTTSHDKELGTCDACDCPLFAKLYVELQTIERNMKPAQRAKLDPRCWITNQSAAGS